MRSLRHRMGSARPPFSPEVPHADPYCTALTPPPWKAFLGSLHSPCPSRNADHLLQLVDGLLVSWQRPQSLGGPVQARGSLTGPTRSRTGRTRCGISPWLTAEVRTALRRHQVEWVVGPTKRRGLPKVLYVNLDDSLGKRSKQTSVGTRQLVPRSRRIPPPPAASRKAFCYLECTPTRGYSPLQQELRLYLRDKTVRRLNRHLALPSVGCTFAASSAWLATSWNRSSRCCRRGGRSTSSSTVGTPGGLALRIQPGHRQGWHAVCGLKSEMNICSTRWPRSTSAATSTGGTRRRAT